MMRACKIPDAEEMLMDARSAYLMSKWVNTSKRALNLFPIGRIGAMAAKQVILQKIRDAEREMLLNDFMSRSEKIFTGTVKRMDKGDMIVESAVSKGACAAAR